mmetsp:Transcript_14610/g.26192  ORF Transcript_14610/g.26192 Transcript_14610/m.26192 type:complete len:213 (+) Transcript_14610:77-715(+)
MGFLALVLSACTDLAFVPALFEVARHRRHFELFVGISQLIVAFAFNLSQALDTQIFLAQNDWHIMSDILTLTYALCLLVHIMGNDNEAVNTGLRYTAFGLAWVFKLRDKWDSTLWEVGLVVAYICLALYCASNHPTGLLKSYDLDAAKKGVACLALALAFLGLELATNGDEYGILLGLMHCSGAGAAFFLWKSVPLKTSVLDSNLRKNGGFV